nr:protein asteroid homolog 1-like [Salvelinus alpinus]
MGVKGLTRFIKDHGNILTDYQFRNSKVVIDGTNLYHSLYFTSGVDQQHGGDYDHFQDQVCKFFKALRDCGIEPYVVIKGGSNYTDEKFFTLKHQVEPKIKNAKALAESKIKNAKALAKKSGMLATFVKNVFIQVLSSLNVPFTQCICEAKQGIAFLAQKWDCPVLSDDSDFYIFDLKAGCLPISHFLWKETSVSHQYTQCMRYTTTRFSKTFNINKQLLPVFAVMVGNDSARFPAFNRILNWLASFQEQKAALELMPSLGGNAQGVVDISKGIKEYDIPETLPSYLEGFFNNDVAPGLDCLPTPLRVLPDWTLLLLMKGKLPSLIVNVLLHKRVIQSAQVENHALVSGSTTSRPIRQVLYGLLLAESRKVEEYDREGINLTSSKVEAILPSAAQELQLDMLNQALQSVRLEVFLETLGVSQSTALLLGLVYGEFCRKSQGVAEGPVLEKLRGLIQNPDLGTYLDLDVAHAYSQWQCCMRDGLDLNQLLCLPLPEPQCAWLYKGTLVHQLVGQLRRGVTPDSLLMEDPSSGQLYRDMLDNLKDCYEVQSQSQSSPSPGNNSQPLGPHPQFRYVPASPSSQVCPKKVGVGKLQDCPNILGGLTHTNTTITTVAHNSTTMVAHNSTTIVAHNTITTVAHNSTTIVAHNTTITVAQNSTTTVAHHHHHHHHVALITSTTTTITTTIVAHITTNMALSLSIETYQIQPGCLERFFNDGKAPDPGLLPDHLSVLPDWTLLPLMKGTLPSYMIYILLLRPVIQGVQVEDHSLPSGNITSRPIRQVFYGLLLGESREVEEYDREGKKLTSSKVKAILPSAARQLQLDTLDQALQSVRLDVFLETLGVSQSTLNSVPTHLGLPVAVTYYWLRHAHPQSDLPLLQALLLGLVYGELCRQRTSQRGLIEEGPVLERLRGLIQTGARSLDLGVSHAFSQWQRCMRDGLDLNQLLCFPLPEPQCAWLYKGTLVHQLVGQLRGGVTPDSLLMEDPSSGQLYRAMLEAILNSQETETTGQPDGPSADSGAGR